MTPLYKIAIDHEQEVAYALSIGTEINDLDNLAWRSLPIVLDRRRLLIKSTAAVLITACRGAESRGAKDAEN